MKHDLNKLEECLDTTNELGCVLKWIAGFKKELRERELICELTVDEIHEFLNAEDDKDEIFMLGKEQGRLEIIKEILEEE